MSNSSTRRSPGKNLNASPNNISCSETNEPYITAKISYLDEICNVTFHPKDSWLDINIEIAKVFKTGLPIVILYRDNSNNPAVPIHTSEVFWFLLENKDSPFFQIKKEDTINKELSTLPEETNKIDQYLPLKNKYNYSLSSPRQLVSSVKEVPGGFNSTLQVDSNLENRAIPLKINKKKNSNNTQQSTVQTKDNLNFTPSNNNKQNKHQKPNDTVEFPCFPNSNDQQKLDLNNKPAQNSKHKRNIEPKPNQPIVSTHSLRGCEKREISHSTLSSKKARKLNGIDSDNPTIFLDYEVANTAKSQNNSFLPPQNQKIDTSEIHPDTPLNRVDFTDTPNEILTKSESEGSLILSIIDKYKIALSSYSTLDILSNVLLDQILGGSTVNLPLIEQSLQRSKIMSESKLNNCPDIKNGSEPQRPSHCFQKSSQNLPESKVQSDTDSNFILSCDPFSNFNAPIDLTID